MLSDNEVKSPVYDLLAQIGYPLRQNVLLSRYCSAQIGGPAEYLIEVNTANQLEKIIQGIWINHVPYTLLGRGSNVLISDVGLSGIVVINRAKGVGRIRVCETAEEIQIWAESGVNLGTLTRVVAEKGLSGLEWATGIPGTVGGAVVNNAGAFNGDIAHSLIMADILQQNPEPDQGISLRQTWTSSDFHYSYRNSRIKNESEQVVILRACLRVEKSKPEFIKAKMAQINQKRKATQPPGASMGSIFKNPPGDYAGRLIEAAGLKGLQVGGAQISLQHANFMVNQGNACAQDFWDLISVVQKEVLNQFDVQLELEIQPLGTFKEVQKVNQSD